MSPLPLRPLLQITEVVDAPNPDFFPKIMFMQYDWVPAPFVLPSFENAIQYSIPYVLDRLTSIISTLFTIEAEEETDEKHYYTELEKKIRQDKKVQISELLSPRSSPAAPCATSPFSF